MFLLHITAS